MTIQKVMMELVVVVIPLFLLSGDERVQPLQLNGPLYSEIRGAYVLKPQLSRICRRCCKPSWFDKALSAIKQQMQFETHGVLVFQWSGSGHDSLVIKTVNDRCGRRFNTHVGEHEIFVSMFKPLRWTNALSGMLQAADERLMNEVKMNTETNIKGEHYKVIQDSLRFSAWRRIVLSSLLSFRPRFRSLHCHSGILSSRVFHAGQENPSRAL